VVPRPPYKGFSKAFHYRNWKCKFLIPWERKWLPVLARRRKIHYWAELRAKKRDTLHVANIPWFFGVTGRFCPAFSPKSGPLGAKLCHRKKNFRSHSSQKLLIFLSLAREAAAAAAL
jgi:hypothetical protein